MSVDFPLKANLVTMYTKNGISVLYIVEACEVFQLIVLYFLIFFVGVLPWSGATSSGLTSNWIPAENLHRYGLQTSEG